MLRPGPRLHADFETASVAKFGKGGVGLYRYAEHPTTRVWCLSYRFDHGPVPNWWLDQPFPMDVVKHVADGGTVVAHNAPFEMHIWNVVLNRQLGGWLPEMKIEQMDCTLARCCAVGLPPDLERAARVVEAPFQKDVTGGATMLKMAKPRNVTFSTPVVQLIWQQDPSRFCVRHFTNDYTELDEASGAGSVAVQWWYDAHLRQVQAEYCTTDVLAEGGVDAVVPALTPNALALWRWNEKVNRRGIPIDVPLVRKVEAVVDLAKKQANRRVWTLTTGAVKKTTEHKRVTDWLSGRGIEAIVLRDGEAKLSVGKGVTDELLALSGNDAAATEVIELHNKTSKSSTAKMTRALEVISSDNRIRGCFGYHIANTGRFAARTWQAHNLVRLDETFELPTVRAFIALCEKFDADVVSDTIEIATGRTMHWLSKMTRPIIKASPGKIFRGVDLSNIEGRVNCWLAGEAWKTQAFVDFDAGIGPDLYLVTAAGLLNRPVESLPKKGAERQNYGKVPDLAGGYQGSVGAYVSMGLNLGVKPEDIAATAAENTDPALWAATAKMYRPRFSSGLDVSVWTGLKIVVNAWRARHPAIVQSWWNRQDAAIMAVSTPGQIVGCCDDKIRYLAQHGFLWCMLPSGRAIAYPSPSIVTVPYIREEKQIIDGQEVIVEIEAYKNAVQVWGLEKNQWVAYTLFGGIQTENDVQGFACDICFDNEGGALALDALGYNLIFHCHDELLSEDDPSFGSTAQMQAMLSRPRSYAAGLPLAAAAWEDSRYIK